jgi:hypothetical protein
MNLMNLSLKKLAYFATPALAGLVLTLGGPILTGSLPASASIAGNWTSIESIRDNVVIFYSTNGAATVASFDNSGNMRILKAYTDFAGAWTRVTKIRDGVILFYNASTGAATVVNFDNSGDIQTQQGL